MTDKSKVALLPCPFCGAIASLDHRRGSYGYYSPRVVARCSNQNCPGIQTFEWDENHTAETKPKAEAEAIIAWNTRPHLAKLELAEKALEQACQIDNLPYLHDWQREAVKLLDQIRSNGNG